MNDQVKYIKLNFTSDFSQYQGSYNYDQAEAAKFYNYIFSYQAPAWQELSAKFAGNENIYFYEYSLGDGFAPSFDRYGYKQFTDSATLSYDNRCESPYSKNPN